MSFRTALLLVLSAVGCSSPQRALPACEVHPQSGDAGAAIGVAADPVLLAAGDIAGCGEDGAVQTAKLLDGMDGTIAALGDNAYERGSMDDYLDCYDPTWGRHRWRTRPTVGNHEYMTPHAAAYFAYFCGSSGEPFKGWYSYELGSWHIVVLNSNCDEVGGCGVGSEQERWLRADLAAHPSKCTAAYWHHPRFSSGEHGDANETAPLWQALDDFDAEVVLAGHEHDYERFERLSPNGSRDDVRGIRQFVVGTGGRPQREFATLHSNSVFRQNGSLGVLSLTLHSDSFDWKFVRPDGSTTDVGQDACH